MSLWKMADNSWKMADKHEETWKIADSHHDFVLYHRWARG